MRQRAALIRTLAVNPQILLLDEAFSALDYQTRLAVAEDIYTIIKRENKTAILVTHDIAESISMADRVAVLTKRPGTVKKIYPVKLTCERKTPINCREAPEFRHYFNSIWRDLIYMYRYTERHPGRVDPYERQRHNKSASKEHTEYLKKSG